jgi:uncharacterized repeat protein (TIGR03803 family)
MILKRRNIILKLRLWHIAAVVALFLNANLWAGAFTNFIQLYSFRGEDGAFPTGNLVETADGVLYGTTRYGGITNSDYPSGMGTIFRFQKQSAHLEIVTKFEGTNGAVPNAGFAKSPDGWLYGTTQFGGTNGNGTIFRIHGSTGRYEVLKHFTGSLDEVAQRFFCKLISAGGVGFGFQVSMVR